MSLGFRIWLWSLLTGSRLKAYLLEGKRLLQSGNHVAALDIYRQIAAQWPNRPEGYQGAAKVYQAMGLRPEAAREAQIARALEKLNRDPDDVQARMDLAEALADKELYSRAAGHIDRALKVAPRNRDLLRLAYQIFQKNRNYRRAVRALEELIRLEPLDAELYERLAENLRAARLHAKATRARALANALKAVREDPGNSEVVDQAVRQLLNNGQRRQALALVERCLKDHPNQSGLLRIYGELLLEEQDTKGAIRALRQAVELDPIDIKAHTLLGRAYLREGMVSKAEHHLNLVKTIEDAHRSNDPLEAHATIVRVLIDNGNLEEARRRAEQLARQHPDDWRAPFVLGMVKRAQGRDAEAKRAFLDSIRLNPNAPEPHLELAKLYSDAGDVMEAVSEARAAVNLAPRDPEVRRALAAVLRAHGYIDQAIEEEELAEAFAKKLS
jgi:tetratricopeptide (TPR) repeat protein